MRLLRFAPVLLPLALLAACGRVPQTSGPIPQDVYVWQRVWGAGVADGLAQASESMEEFVVFAGQITLTAGTPKIARPQIDYQPLKKTGRRVGLALRVDPYAGPFRSDDAAIRSITQLAREQLAEVRRHGIEPVELHFDFDCAESKLADYRLWLAALREAVKPLPVYPTVLPSWLKHDSFASLARDSGQFILQVHCVEPPRRVEDTRMLTDPRAAEEWVRQAARIGVPFRVALPTYTYLVAFTSEGKPLGVSAEGPSARWPAKTQVVRWEADPSAMAGLVSAWNRRRPALLKGIIWYRLPIATDAYNWRWVTLAAAMQGREPVSDLRMESSTGEPSDLALKNQGERDEPLPEQIEATFEGSSLVAADALADYEIVSRSPAQVIFRRKPGAALSRLSPGAARPIGWIRCEKPARIRMAAPGGADRTGSHDHSVPANRTDDGH